MSKKEAELEANRVFAITDKNNSGYIDYTGNILKSIIRIFSSYNGSRKSMH